MSERWWYFDRAGQQVSMERWLELVRQGDYRIVAQHEVGDSRVSTVWLGLDHGLGDDPPVIFETLVFGGRLDDAMERYSTEAQAIAGHWRMIGHVREAAGEPVEVIECAR